MDREYTVNDLIEAKLLAVQFSGKHPDLDEFHSSRYRALAGSFGVDVSYGSTDVDRSGLSDLVAHAVDAYQNLRSPFSGYLFAPPDINDLYQQFGPEINDGLKRAKRAIEALLVAAFGRLHEVPLDKTVIDDDLRRYGFDPSTPWPDEFDYL